MTTYRLWPSTDGGTLDSSTSAFTLGVEFSVSQTAYLDGYWWWCAAGADTTAKQFCLFNATTTFQFPASVVTSGTLTANSWNYVPLVAQVTLAASTEYRAAVFGNPGAAWFGSTQNYWSSGGGAAGITNGILTAPNAAGAVSNAQDSFAQTSAPLTFPSNTFMASNYWIDVQIDDTQSGSHAGTAPLTVTPSFTANRLRGTFRAAALTVTPAVVAAGIVTPGSYRGFTVPGMAVPGRAIPGVMDPGLPVGQDPEPAVVIQAATPYFRWAAGTPYFRWAAGGPYVS